MFIARISKGRTIREFLTCVLLIPTLFSFLWFSVFGILASETYAAYPLIAQMPSEQVLFGILQTYTASTALSVITVLLLFIFFITSADSATFVLSMLSEKGSLMPHDSVKIVWGPWCPHRRAAPDHRRAGGTAKRHDHRGLSLFLYRHFDDDRLIYRIVPRAAGNGAVSQAGNISAEKRALPFL